ncbi:MAG: hypothetical protein Q8P18_07605 [Pseudomonadota bacterium]|nr:hypothetical protein [Pseudomonadota bacterium]
MALSDPAFPPGTWIISRTQDLTWFWGSALVGLGAGALVLLAPWLALPLFCAWMVGVDGPHFWATWTRSVWDPAERARRGALVAGSFLIFLPGFAAWAVARATGADVVWIGFLLLAAVWAYHHGVRQDFGIWSLYARRAGLSVRERTVDAWFLYGARWGLFAWFSLAHPLSRAELEAAGLAWISAPVGWAVLAWMVAFPVVLAVRYAKGRPVLPGLFILLPCIGYQAVGFAVIGLAEPLVPGFSNVEQAFAVLALSNGVAHGLQYLGLVAWAGKNRHPRGGPSLSARLSARPGRAWLVYVALSVPYLAVNLLRTAAPGVHIAGPTVEGLALCVYWGFVLHHYLLDQYIWRPHADPILRAELRVA